MTASLISISIKNFMGGKDVFHDFKGAPIVNIEGFHASGKTLVKNAYYFCLFGKNAYGDKNFSVKERDAEGEDRHNTEPTVELVFDIEGTLRKFARATREVWTKKRNEEKQTYDGNETLYWIDDVPTTQTRYNQAVTEIFADEETYKCVSDPLYFATGIDYKRRRAQLVKFFPCKEVPVPPELSELLAGRSVDDAKAIATQNRKKTNERQQEIPGLIAEREKVIAETSTAKPTVRPMNQIDGRRTILQRALLNLSAGSEKEKRLRELSVEREEVVNEWLRTVQEERRRAQSELSDAQAKRASAESLARSAERTIASLTEEAERTEAERIKLRADYATAKAEEFHAVINDKCPTCNQILPEDQIQSAMNEAAAQFNQRKAKTLADILSQGEASKARMDTIQAEREKIRIDLARYNNEIRLHSEAEVVATRKLEDLKTRTDDGPDGEYESRISVIDAQIEASKSMTEADTTEKRDAINAELEILESEAELWRKYDAALDSVKSSEARIEELTAEQKRNAAELNRIDKLLYLAEQYNQMKMSALADTVNAHFKSVRFRMFRPQINGGTEEVCEPLVNSNGSWVPFSPDGNGAQRLIAGLEIIDVLSNALGLHVPIFIDERQVCLLDLQSRSQLISLIATHDPTIHITLQGGTNGNGKETVAAATTGEADLFGGTDKAAGKPRGKVRK